jgi:hypothetical protein
MFNNFFFFQNRPVYETWKIIAEPDKPQVTIWRMGFTWWIPKAANTRQEHVILIALPLQ